jgi:hypothetical protein
MRRLSEVTCNGVWNVSVDMLVWNFITSLLVPVDAGRIGTNIYVITVETSQPVEARYTSCTQLL